MDETILLLRFHFVRIHMQRYHILKNINV